MFICFFIYYQKIHGCYKKIFIFRKLVLCCFTPPRSIKSNGCNLLLDSSETFPAAHRGLGSMQCERAAGEMVWKCSPHHKYVSSIFSCCGRKTATNTWTVNHLAWNMFKYECSSWKMKSMEFWHPLWLLRDEQLGYAKKGFLD